MGIPAILPPLYGCARTGFMPEKPKPVVGVSGLLQSSKYIGLFIAFQAIPAGESL